MESKKIIEFRNIVKNFDGQIVLKGVNLDIYENEFVTLLGPSGCGKTTLLRILGGFLDADEGQVIFDGEEISKKPPYERELNTVFQKYALFPHLNVYENIAFGLKLKKVSKDIIDQKVMKMLKLIGLEGYEKKNTTLLSGGQQQRVAIARALVNEPKVLLLDEPLAALDLKMRKEMQYELKRIQQEVGITFIFVTHDQEEALTMSDKIVVMNNGEIQQVGSPEDIYNEPSNRFVANFIGESNLIPGTMLEDYKVRFDDVVFDCVDFGFKENESVDVVIRPEDIDIVVFTHLHWDHCFYMDKFTNAKFYVNKKEYEFAMDPIPLYYKSYEAPQLGITRPFEGIKMELLEGEAEVMPGVRVFETPGHSIGHQSVEIDTAAGRYICCGDAIFIMDNTKPIEEIHYDITPPNRFSDIVSAWKSIELIKARAESLDKILTCHDREMLDRVSKTPILGL